MIDQKVYFSKIGDMDDWVAREDSGIAHIILIPKRWWSVSDWKIIIDFKNHFKSGFITKEPVTHPDERKIKND